MGGTLSTAMAKFVEEVRDEQIMELENYRTKSKLYSPYEIMGTGKRLNGEERGRQKSRWEKGGGRNQDGRRKKWEKG